MVKNSPVKAGEYHDIHFSGLQENESSLNLKPVRKHL